MEEPHKFSSEHPYTYYLRDFPGGSTVPVHYHSTLEINIIRDVEGLVTINGSSFALAHSQCLYFPPGTIHSYEISPCRGSISVFHLSLDDVGQFINMDRLFQLGGLDLHSLPVRLPYGNWEREILQLIRAPKDPLGFLQFAIRLPGLLKNSDKTAESIGHPRNWGRIKRVLDHIQVHYGDDLNLNRSASLAGMSRYYFSRQFSEITGMNYQSYVTKVRLEQAAQLLGQEPSVTRVCFDCGFSNLSHFIARFKAVYGVTPKQYAAGHGSETVIEL